MPPQPSPERQAGVPVLDDDGQQSFLQADGVLAGIDATGSTTYSLADGLGSIRVRTDGVGTLIGTTDYDAWGTVRGSTGSQGTFGFAGEQTDAETGLLHLRARPYAPGLGRFLSRDPMSPSKGGTQGYQPYAYAGNNPTTLTDPSGLAPDGGLLGLAPAIAGVFFRLTWILDCAFYGECFAPGTTSGGGTVGGPGTGSGGPTGEGWSTRGLDVAPSFFPPLPFATSSSQLGRTSPIVRSVKAESLCGKLIDEQNPDFDDRNNLLLDIDWLMFAIDLVEFHWYRDTCAHSTSTFLNWNSDGCSAPAWVPQRFDFTRACDRHDFGYRNFEEQQAMTESVRELVDRQLKKDTDYLCDSDHGGNSGCLLQGSQFYEAVRACGDRFDCATTAEACVDDFIPGVIEDNAPRMRETMRCLPLAWPTCWVWSDD